MSAQSFAAIRFGKVSRSVEQWLGTLHRRGKLLSMLGDFAIEELLLEEASKMDISVSTEDLQRAADRCRLRNGLSSAEETHSWLAQQHLTLDDFEASIERDLRIERFREQVGRDSVADRFEEHKFDYARACLRQIVVAREDLACELLSQLRQEGRDFSELAFQHSMHPSRSDGGRLGVVLRRQLPQLVAGAVFAARAGQVIGPLATPDGFLLLLVEELQPADLDDMTAKFIREELFADWLSARLAEAPVSFPVLDTL